MGFLYVKTEDGRKKPSVFIWLILLAILLIVSIFLVTNTRDTGLAEITGNTKQKQEQEQPVPVEKGESKKAMEGMDAETTNEMSQQIDRETDENNGYLPPDREKAIAEKFKNIAEERKKANFQPSVQERMNKLSRPDPTPTPQPREETEQPKLVGYKTLNQRLGEGGDGNRAVSSNRPIDFGEVPAAWANQTDNNVTTIVDQGNQKAPMKNFLPLGTFIACVLDGDIVTSALSSHIWATVVIDVTFRRQLQLPKGLVRLRGTTGTEPVQNVVDIVFDTMVFSDGTELALSGFAYSAFDPRYPHRFRTRGIPGEIIVPPMWVKLRSLIYSAALGASDAYIQNYINENTTTDNNFTTTPVIDPVTGQVTTQIQETQTNPVNANIGATVGLSAAQSALTDLVKDVQKDAEKYKPYLIVEKGTPFFVQLDNTINIDSRQMNGTAIAAEEKLKHDFEMSKRGVPMPNRTETYPPGDARAKYTGADRSDGGPGTTNPLSAITAGLNAIQNSQQAPYTNPAGTQEAGTPNIDTMLKNLQ